MLPDKRSTPWCEGRPDEGIGDALVIDLGASVVVSSLRIAANIWAPHLFEANKLVGLEDDTP